MFSCGFSTKETCVFLLQENTKEISELITLKPWKAKILIIINEIKVSRVPF